MSRTAKTTGEYRVRALALLRQAKRELGIDRITPGQLVDWFSSHHDSWLASTIRQYRAAITQLVSDEIEFAAFDKNVGISLLKNLRGHIGEDGRQTAPRPTKVSARPKKLKALSFKQATRLGDRLHQFHTDTGKLATKIVSAGPDLGVRSCEWDSIEVYRDFLRVRNAKFTNTRATGDLRVIIFPTSERRSELLTVTNEIVTMIHNAKIPWKQLQRRINYTLRRASYAIGLKRPATLSTLRHIAIGRWKGIFTPDEVAALAGHASNATAMYDYGRRRSGRKWPPVIVAPYFSPLAPIRDRFCTYEQRKTLSISI